MEKWAISERLKLAECAICPYSFKKFNTLKLKCNWDETKTHIKPCDKIKECGHWDNWFDEI